MPGVVFVPTGEDAFGFSSLLDKHTQTIPPSTPLAAFDKPTTPASYIDKLTYDPTKAKYFDLFNVDIVEENKKPGRSKAAHNYRQTSYKLNEQELALFSKNGFVVSERAGAQSFAEVFYKLYSDDLPVFVTGDSILHAWHHTYDKVLEAIEQNALLPCLDSILTGMSNNVPATHKQTKAQGDGVLEPCVLDADYFLSVALSLLKGELVAGHLNQQARIKTTLDAVAAEKVLDFDLFGRGRTVDFSLFKPRGHYTTSEKLQKYFKAMIWCSTIDLRIAGKKEEVSTRELGSAVVLHSLISSSSNLLKAWKDFDAFLQKFIGLTDSMTFEQMGNVLKSAKISSVAAIKQESDLVALQEHILGMDAGHQNIGGHFYFSPASNDQVVLPRAFTVLGQKFTLDSWVTSNVTYDHILDENGVKVQRRIPSALDVAYTVFNNDHVVPELSRMMQDKNGVKFRDGLPYHSRLLALRKVIEAIPENMWKSSIYFQWLATLRALSTPPSAITECANRDAAATSTSSSTSESKSVLPSWISKHLPGNTSDVPPLPQVARTQAWQDRITNTQCASWAQLRHDTILYVKQSCSFGTCCEYPEGYVEPNPVFWRQFLKMATTTHKLVDELKFPEVVVTEEMYGRKYERSNKTFTERILRVYTRWIKVLEKLVSISEKQANNQPLTNDMKDMKDLDRSDHQISFGARLSGPLEKMSEVRFLKNVIEASHGSGATNYLGWYPTLFYEEGRDSGKWDPIIADVHTDFPDDVAGDPGCVLHEGVGNIHTMIVSVDRGDSVICYAGPVLSHYEFTCPINERKNDTEWRDIVRKTPPAHPRWTQSFLVPGTNPNAAEYKHKDENGDSFPY